MELKEPPLLTGDAAEKNRALRALKGCWTDADMVVYWWCCVNVPADRWTVTAGTYEPAVIYKGEQLWPPE